MATIERRGFFVTRLMTLPRSAPSFSPNPVVLAEGGDDGFGGNPEERVVLPLLMCKCPTGG